MMSSSYPHNLFLDILNILLIRLNGRKPCFLFTSPKLAGIDAANGQDTMDTRIHKQIFNKQFFPSRAAGKLVLEY